MSRLISASFIKHGPVYEHWCLRTSGIVYEHVCLRTPGLVYEHTCLRTLGSVYEHGCLRTPGCVYEHVLFTNMIPRLVYEQPVLANAGLLNAFANEQLMTTPVAVSNKRLPFMNIGILIVYYPVYEHP